MGWRVRDREPSGQGYTWNRGDVYATGTDNMVASGKRGNVTFEALWKECEWQIMIRTDTF